MNCQRIIDEKMKKFKEKNPKATSLEFLDHLSKVASGLQIMVSPSHGKRVKRRHWMTWPSYYEEISY